jgi:CheY-like chemotaxis protein
MSEVQHILFVDDNPGDRDLAREILEINAPDIALHTANDGEEAMDFLQRRKVHAAAPRPSVVLLDLNMPRKDGLETLKEIKADMQLRSIPVVIFSSSSARSDLQLTYQSHANAYVIKPPSLEDYTRVIQEIGTYWCHTANPH